MRLKIKILIVFLFTLLFGFHFPHNAFAANYNLSGSIKDSTGAAITGATVSVNDTNSDHTTTDSSGNYILSIPSGTYNVQITPPSGSNYTSAIALAQNISTDTVLNFILVNSGSVILSGHLYDPLGNPLSNQSISLTNTSTGATVASTTTDSGGNYSLQVAPANYGLFVTGTNSSLTLNAPRSFQLYTFSYNLSQSTILDITVPAKKVIVHVQDPTGAAVSGVEVDAAGTGGSNVVNVNGITLGGSITVNGISREVPGPMTDSSGNAILWLLPTNQFNTYDFTATPPSGSIYLKTVLSSLAITSDTTETITLQQPVTLSGHVYDPLGNPLANQTVALNAPSSGTTVASATTDSSGSYSIQVAPNSYTYNISGINSNLTLNIPRTYQLYTFSYPITVNQNTVIDFKVPAKKVVIHVQDAAGNAISGAEVDAVGGTGNVISQNDVTIASTITNSTAISREVPGPLTDSSGNAILWLLPTDSSNWYNFTVTPPSGSNYFTTTLSNISVTTDTTKTIVLQQPVTLSGHVYDPLGNPLSNQSISLTNTSTGATVASTTTDSTGSYSLQATSGTYGFFVTGANSSYSLNLPKTYQLYTFSFTIAQNKTLDITLPFKKVSVHVQNPLSQGLSGVEIDAAVPGGGTVNSGGLLVGGIYMSGTNNEVPGPLTDSSGNTTLWLVPNNLGGTYTFTATPPSSSTYNVYTLTNISVTSDQTEFVSLQYNHSTPITTAVLSPSANGQGQYTDPTTVTLSATAAAGYTIANTYYTVDGGTQQTYTAPFTITGGGSHNITYWSVDNSGVQEAPNTKTFTIQSTYTLSGTVYNDANKNGIQDSGENDISGETVTLNTGQTTTTDSSGNYSFPGLVPGTYTETLTVPSGYTATTANPATVTLRSDTTENFGIVENPPVTNISLSPTPYADGTYQDPTTVTLSATATSPYTVAAIYYKIDSQAQATYTTPFTVTGSGSHTITYWSVDSNGVTEPQNTKTFTISEAYTLSGTIYVDENQNGVQDTGEPAYQGVTVTLNTGQTTTTDSNGSYSFGSIESGNYTETVDLPTGFNATTTNPVTVPLSQDTTENFGIVPQAPSIGAITVNPDPVQINTAVAASSTFTEPIANPTDSAVWNWGDNSTSSGLVTEPSGTTQGSVSGSHSYSVAGVYTVTLQLMDQYGISSTQTFQYVSVYAPTNQGVFSAGQQFTAVAGDYPQNPTLTGTVKFGLAYKYSGGMPVGDRQFMMTFKAANLSFNATTITALVISNGTATLTGTGTINGSGTYNFAVVGVNNSDVRVQITDPSNNNAVIFDTQPGGALTDTPTTPVTGQVIVN